ncbi:biotin carboxylase N-terminal domain-containing protein [Lentzea sp. BCCO 10_0061]|uniref:Biotin carboxylase N-terminal domain-containing protein n=1 Tax=Lentzea sokolovensis TaxID=3095429 RepID=A0ABU4V4Y9_9PSEU|nr:biotin carboxylase N-terminal domain-containing protein [Lentzea sp. BCCO 10_0061]MDX8146799.1 biotin carboxylase N-terminal domain-containing protein [Lentzea sp. BCCO 10_0061]
MIKTLLIANRGEIARRIIRTCQANGIRTVAVFSDPDDDSPHVREADFAVRLPGASPTETYLRADLLVEAATKAGADAVHPGYGFLSENADFARKVQAAGLTWVGPEPDSIEAMGSKVAAKKRMAAAGVPTLPELDPETVTEFPVLIKASAGGGGRGMRIVREKAGFADALASARREAESAFGDPTVFCEPLLEHARHVEVQILADTHGTVWALGERECSIQRRHQKIVEESPSPAVTDDVRKRLFAAATAAAESIGYVGAGTVEFMLKGEDFHFLEVNTRLQVEHPVTELVHGVDLVEWQLRIAEGARLPADVPQPRGHAIEVRLYAEDPSNDWRPASGTLHRFHVPGDVRLDSGVEDGSVVSVHYDPMLAKVIAYAPTRRAAARKLATALESAQIHGLVTNRALLVDILGNEAFLNGDTHTGFLTEHDFSRTVDPQPFARAAALAQAASRKIGHLPLGWRNVRSQQPKARFLVGEELVEVEYDPAQATPGVIALDLDGVRTPFHVARYGDLVEVDSPRGSLSLKVVPRFPEPETKLAPGATIAPMPGTVVRVSVAQGDVVEAGAELLVLEAMKMEHRVLANNAGTVTELLVEQAQQVNAGDVLAVVAEESGD